MGKKTEKATFVREIQLRNIFKVYCVLFIFSFLFVGCFSEKKIEFDNSNINSLNSPSNRVIPASSVPAEPYVIKKPGYYSLAGNRLCKGTGLIIEAANVTIDFTGYELVGSGKDSGENYGILTNQYSNLEVRNGTIRDFGDRGIVDRGKQQKAGYRRIISMRVINNGSCGICVGGPANLIKDCICSENGQAGICPGYRCMVVGNLCHSNGSDGILAGRGCTIKQNVVSENDKSGIVAYSGCLVIENTVYMNNRKNEPDSGGIVLENGCLVKSNALRDNGINNIYITDKGNYIQDNSITALKNPGIGIFFSANKNMILNNNFAGNKVDLAGQAPK